MKTKLFLSVLAGFVLGVVAMWFVVKQTTVKVFENQYLVSVMDQANVALHIRAGKQMALLTNIEAALPSYVLQLTKDSEDTRARRMRSGWSRRITRGTRLRYRQRLRASWIHCHPSLRNPVRFACERWIRTQPQMRRIREARNEQWVAAS